MPTQTADLFVPGFSLVAFKYWSDSLLPVSKLKWYVLKGASLEIYTRIVFNTFKMAVDKVIYDTNPVRIIDEQSVISKTEGSVQRTFLSDFDRTDIWILLHKVLYVVVVELSNMLIRFLQLGHFSISSFFLLSKVSNILHQER